MIDYLTLALTHGLIALALWRLSFRAELDDEATGEGQALAARKRPWVRKRPVPADAPDA